MGTTVMVSNALDVLVLAHRDWDGANGWWAVFPLLWLVVIGTLVTFLVVTSRRRSRYSGQRAGEQRLAERFAAGEIDEGEYQQRLATLRTGGRP